MEGKTLAEVLRLRRLVHGVISSGLDVSMATRIDCGRRIGWGVCEDREVLVQEVLAAQVPLLGLNCSKVTV